MSVIPGANLGKPASTNRMRLLGAVSLNAFFYAFTIQEGTDTGNPVTLYCKMSVNNLWGDWISLGSPFKAGSTDKLSFNTSYQGSVLVSGGQFFVYACGSDGNAYCCYYNTKTWAWVKIGQPPNNAVKGVGIAQPNPLGFWVQTAASAWFAGLNGVWTEYPQVSFAALEDVMLRLDKSPRSRVKFQIDGSQNLICGVGGEDIDKKASGQVWFHNESAGHASFRLRAFNPDGVFLESESTATMGGPGDPSSNIATVNLQPAKGGIPAISGLVSGATCWAYCAMVAGVTHCSGDNFTYDPYATNSTIHYDLTGASLTPSFNTPRY